MDDWTSHRIKMLALAVLDDDTGISEEAWLHLQQLLRASGQEGIIQVVKSTEGRIYLPRP